MHRTPDDEIDWTEKSYDEAAVRSLPETRGCESLSRQVF